MKYAGNAAIITAIVIGAMPLTAIASPGATPPTAPTVPTPPTVMPKTGTVQAAPGLTAFKPGNYTLTVKTTSNDDGLAPQSCLGKASMGIAIIAAPGQIKDVKLEA